MIDKSLVTEATENIGDCDDLVDGIVHFLKKNKTKEEKEKIDEKSEDFRAAGKIVKSAGKVGVALLGIAALIAAIKK